MAASYNSATERNKNAQLTSGYDEIARSLYTEELSIVGNYEIGEMIGKGSFGKVYVAHHTMTRTKVVVKAADKSETEGLAREIYHHRRLRHPHITKLYEVIHTEKQVWLVLEYCHGGELYDYLLKNKRLQEPVAQRMFAQLCGAVAYIHKAGCIHRDLKLENILLDKSDNIKLADFGFTREYDSKKLLETWCGTYAYAAPEVLEGKKYSGEAVDVWSMGVILYALLCGELPFDEEDEMKIKERIVKRDYKLPEYLSPDAKSLISSIFASPEDRPTLPKILEHPFLASHASRQLQILAHIFFVPFASPVEKRLLDRFEKANIDTRILMQQMSEGGSGSLIGLWELSLEQARKREEYKKRKRRRRKSRDIEIIETSAQSVPDDLTSTPQELTPLENRFPGEFSVPKLQVFTEDHTSRESRTSRGDKPPSLRSRSRSRSRSPSKGRPYRGPTSPQKPKASKGIFQALRSLLSDWSQRQGQKLIRKRSKAILNPNGNGTTTKEVKNPIEPKTLGESKSKEELKRNRKAHLPNITIEPPVSRPEEQSPVSYGDTGSPYPANYDYEPDGNGGTRRVSYIRPSDRRRSTSSSINSLRSRHRYSHSKTSSTSSAGSGSVSTPRHSKGSLKIVPATPPPHTLMHEGAKGHGPFWGEGTIIARRRRSPFRGPPVGFMSTIAGGKRKGQGKQSGKWPEGAIQEEDEDELDENVIEDGDVEGDVEEMGRGSCDVAELGAVRRGSDGEADGRGTSASV